jgi:hypothetical protein
MRKLLTNTVRYYAKARRKKKEFQKATLAPILKKV